MNEPAAPIFEGSGSLTPPPPIPAVESRIFFGSEGLRAGWGILLFAVLILTLGSAINFLANKGEQTFGHAASRGEAHVTSSAEPHPETAPALLYASEGFSLLAVFLATFTLSLIERRPFTVYGLGGARRTPHFAQGLLCGILCLSFLIATLHLTGHLPFDARLLPTPTALRYGIIWAIGFLLVAFLEENLLRGYLQYTLTRGFRSILRTVLATPNEDAYAFWLAALVLSFIFGLGHSSNPGESPIGLLSAGLAGLVFCLSLYRTGSLWWALGFHAAWDWGQSFLFGVPDSGSMVQHHLFATHPVGPPILSGGLTGPEGSIFILPTLALAVGMILLTVFNRRATTET